MEALKPHAACTWISKNRSGTELDRLIFADFGLKGVETPKHCGLVLTDCLRSQETLLADGHLHEFRSCLGKAAFVSHQWTARSHPDPEMKQFKVQK